MTDNAAKKPPPSALLPCKRDRTRVLLIEAAIDVLSERGLEGCSIDDLMRVAGMARGTFYNHFESRENLVACTSNFIREKIYQAVVDRVPKSYSAEETFTCITFGFIHYALKHPKTGWALVRIGGSTQWVSGARFSRAGDVMAALLPELEKASLGLIYIEGVALMVLRRLLEKVITIEEAETIIVLAMRGVGIDSTHTATLLKTAKKFVSELHLR